MDITSADLFTILVLVFLEGILSIDNALVLAMMARPLPKEQQQKALTYGLIGAVVFRLIALFFITLITKNRWIKILGGAYLIFISVKHFFSRKKEDGHEGGHAAKAPAKVSFWKTVLMIELTDIAFAVDSILAAVAMSNKFWVIFTGGFIGVVLMRYAAKLMISVLQKFPNLENTAYQLVLLIGVKVILETLDHHTFDFHSVTKAPFWIFWALMLTLILLGFRRGSAARPGPETAPR